MVGQADGRRPLMDLWPETSTLEAEYVVALALDTTSDYLHGVLALIHSLGDTGDSGAQALVLLHNGLDAGIRAALTELCDQAGLPLEAIRCDTTAGPADVAGAHFGPAACLRIGLPHVLPGVSRALYLDADTIVARPLTELCDLDLDGWVLGAVVDPRMPAMPAALRTVAGLPPDGTAPYFNSGVLLFDLANARAASLTGRCAELLATTTGPVRFPDQDLLNVACAGTWKALDPVYNAVPVPRILRRMAANAANSDDKLPADGPDIEQQIRIEEQARVLHYLGPTKPWHPAFRDGPALELFRRHHDAAATPELLELLGG